MYALSVIKEHLIFSEDLHNDTLFDGDCVAIVAADFERLVQGEAA